MDQREKEEFYSTTTVGHLNSLMDQVLLAFTRQSQGTSLSLSQIDPYAKAWFEELYHELEKCLLSRKIITRTPQDSVLIREVVHRLKYEDLKSSRISDSL